MPRERLVSIYKNGKRNYEVTFIVKQTLSQEALAKKVEEAEKIARDCGAEIVETASTSLKSYAYPIEAKNNLRGYYACLYLKAEAKDISEIRRRFTLLDDVLRVLIILSNPQNFSKGIFDPNYEDESEKKRRSFAYSDPNSLSRFVGERAKIDPRKQTPGKNMSKGVASRQRKISKNIKRSRYLSLLGYISD